MLAAATISRQIQSLLERPNSIVYLLQIHTFLLKTAFDHHRDLISMLISSLCPLSNQHALSVFNQLPFTPSIYLWNSMIRSYSSKSRIPESVRLFSELRRGGVMPDSFTYSFVLKACGNASMVEQGRMVHGLVVKVGFLLDSYVGNNLLHMYAGSGRISCARKVFDEMLSRDVVGWSSMIGAYVARSLSLEALKVFQQMQVANVNPNSITLVSLLSACTRLTNLRIGCSIHSFMIVNAIKLDVALGSALVEMYAKCGRVDEAFWIFDSLEEKNLQSWTIMISGFADNSRGKEAISLFTQMENDGVKPDSVSFSSILSACSHSGLVDEGQNYFDMMVNVYKIKPRMEHYGCMIDMFGRAGMVQAAYEFIKSMPLEPNGIMLRSFLAACRKHGTACNVDEQFMKLLIKEDFELGANYVLAANVSALSGNWDEAAELRSRMLRKGLMKVAGCSWVESNAIVVCSPEESVRWRGEELVGNGLLENDGLCRA